MVVTISVAANQAASGKTREPLREISDHVAAIHLAVHQYVDAQPFLFLDPERGGLALEIVKVFFRNLLFVKFGASLCQIIRFWEAANRSGREQGQLHAKVFKFLAAHRRSRPSSCARTFDS